MNGSKQRPPTEKSLWDTLRAQAATVEDKANRFLSEQPLASLVGAVVCVAILVIIWLERDRGLWAWMQLLVVPLGLSLAAFLLNRWQKQNERELAADKQRQAMLESYFDKMADLLLGHDLRSGTNSEAKSIARTRTLSLFRRLDGDRKGAAMQFLYEAGLIAGTPVVPLNGVDLTDTALRGATLAQVDLRGVDVSRADLTNAQLRGAELGGTILRGAILRNAKLQDADLRLAILEGADLRGGDFAGANLYGANLRNALTDPNQFDNVKSLRYATMPDGHKHRP